MDFYGNVKKKPMQNFIKTLKILGQIIVIIISFVLFFAISCLTETKISMTDQTFHRPISISDFFIACVGIGLLILLSYLFEKKEKALQL